MRKSGEAPVELSLEAAVRLKVFVVEVKRLWPGAELLAVRRSDLTPQTQKED